MRASSFVKWMSVFAATGVLSVLFFHRSGLDLILGAAYAAAAVAGLATTLAEAVRAPRPEVWLERALRAAFYLMGLALVIGLIVAVTQL
jgi:hypothetical protein